MHKVNYLQINYRLRALRWTTESGCPLAAALLEYSLCNFLHLRCRCWRWRLQKPVPLFDLPFKIFNLLIYLH